MRANEILRQEEGLALLPDDNLPLLPEWNDALSLPPTFDEYMQENAKKKAENQQKEQE
jgi:general secretion pathway protein D